MACELLVIKEASSPSKGSLPLSTLRGVRSMSPGNASCFASAALAVHRVQLPCTASSHMIRFEPSLTSSSSGRYCMLTTGRRSRPAIGLTDAGGGSSAGKPHTVIVLAAAADEAWPTQSNIHRTALAPSAALHFHMPPVCAKGKALDKFSPARQPQLC